jgi:hypothetical protein
VRRGKKFENPAVFTVDFVLFNSIMAITFVCFFCIWEISERGLGVRKKRGCGRRTRRRRVVSFYSLVFSVAVMVCAQIGGLGVMPL